MTQVEFEALIRALLAKPVLDEDRDQMLWTLFYAVRPAEADK